MKDIILQSSFYLLIAIFITIGSAKLESDYLYQYLDSNLVTILIAFLAVSIASISIISTKIKEVTDETGTSFESTIKSLRFSIKEQLFYIALAIIVSVLNKSVYIMSLSPYSKELITMLLVWILLSSFHIIYDTVNSIFIIFESE